MYKCSQSSICLFPHRAHFISQRQVQVEHGSIDCTGCFHHELSSLICSEQRRSPSSISKLHHTQITGCREIHNNPSVYPRAFANSLHSLLEFVQDCNVVEFLEFSPIWRHARELHLSTLHGNFWYRFWFLCEHHHLSPQ